MVPVSFFVWKCHPVPAAATTRNSLAEVEIVVASFIFLFVSLCAFQLQFHSCFVLLSWALNACLCYKYKSTVAQSGPTRTEQRIRQNGFTQKGIKAVTHKKYLSWKTFLGQVGKYTKEVKEIFPVAHRRHNVAENPQFFFLHGFILIFMPLRRKIFFVLSLALCKCSWCVVVFSDNIYSYKVTLHSPALTDLFPRMPGVTPKLTLQPELIIA